MTEATLTWSIWQALLQAFARSFTRRGFRRFAEWITAMALNVEEHTITQSVLALEQPAAWKALETFAEYGGWHEGRVTYDLTRLVETAPGRIWHGYHVSAVDDTKVHRCSPHVWGTCTFHEYTARCPNRAGTVRAHNWVVLGALLHEPAKPGWFLPIAGRLYFRKSQLPAGPGGHRWRSGPSASWPSSCSASRRGSPPATSTWASSTAATPCGASSGRWSCPRTARPGSTFLTRLRHDARLYALPPAERPAGSRGPKPKWGRRLEPPRRGGRWERGVADRHRLRLRPAAEGPLEGGRVPVAGAGLGGAGQGDRRRGRGVQEAVHAGDLGGGADRAADGGAVRGPVPARGRVPRPEAAAGLGGVPGVDREPDRADQPVQWVTMSLLRLLQFRLEAAGEEDWWFRPPWNKDKDRPSVLDAERLMRRHRAEIQRLLSEWLGDEGETEEAVA